MSHPNPKHDPENVYPEDIISKEMLTDMFGEGGAEEVVNYYLGKDL